MSHELALTAMTRARMCELVVTASRRATPRRLGVHRRPVIAAGRAPRGADGENPRAARAQHDVKGALVGRDGPLGPAAPTRRSVRESELVGRAGLAEQTNIASDALPEMYVTALCWARERVDD